MTNDKNTPTRKGERLQDAKDVHDLLVRFELACMREKLKFEPQQLSDIPSANSLV